MRKKKKEAFPDVEFTTELTVRPAAHEIFLSFTNDDDAVAFHAWWNVVGSAQFKKWFDSNKDYVF